MDKDDPFLERNLARLEMRFQERHQASVENQTRRGEEGKPPHQTILRSMSENQERLGTTRLLRRILLEKTNESTAKRKKNET